MLRSYFINRPTPKIKTVDRTLVSTTPAVDVGKDFIIYTWETWPLSDFSRCAMLLLLLLMPLLLLLLYDLVRERCGFWGGGGCCCCWPSVFNSFSLCWTSSELSFSAVGRLLDDFWLRRFDLIIMNLHGSKTYISQICDKTLFSSILTPRQIFIYRSNQTNIQLRLEIAQPT